MITSKKSFGSVVFKLFITLNFIVSPWAYAQEGGQGGRCEIAFKSGEKDCIEARTIGGLLTKEACAQCKWIPGGIQQKSACLASCGVEGSTNMNTAAGLCAKGIETCKEGCQPSGETGKCDQLKIMLKRAVGEMTEYTSITGQALEVVNSTGGTGLPTTNPAGDGLTWKDAGKALAIAGLAGAGVAAIASMSNKSSSSQQNNSSSSQASLQPLPTDQTPAEQAGCGTNADAHRYSACNDYYSTNCSTTATDATCQAFFVRYCGTGTASVGSEVNSLTVDKTGEGMGQTICRNIVAKQYCAVSGRDACPSCQNVNSQSSPSCTDQSGSTAVNPNLCVPQLDQAQKDAAKVTCPTDPLFMNPSFSQVATGTTSGLPQIVIASAGGGWRDVASADSANLFNVSSTTMQNLCAKGKLNCP